MKFSSRPYLVALILCLSAAAKADKGDFEPLWEAGIGTGFYGGSSYPGSDDTTSQALAVPYVIYRGERLSIGEEGGVRALAYADERVEFDLSLGASLDADSEDDADRAGMPDLDFLFEIGPQVIFHAARHDYQNWRGQFDIKLRARSVVATDFAGFDPMGFVIEPAFVYEMKSRLDNRLEWQFDIEILYGTEKLNDYFYQVDAAYATAQRPVFDAKAGYIGTELGIGMAYPLSDRVQLYGGFDIEFYSGAANADSPLFKENIGYSGGFALVYKWRESARMVKRQ